jgi:ankyrin repeat protein
MEAVSGENIEIVKLLMVNGADLNATDSNGLTALFYCLNSNNMVTMLEIAKVISEKSGYSQPGVSSFWIAFGAKIKGYDIAKSKGSILILSIVQGNFELVKTLIERGADINAADEEGNTPLILSVVYNNADIAKYLIEKGAHKNTKNNYSKTASDYLNKNNSSLVELFK